MCLFFGDQLLGVVSHLFFVCANIGPAYLLKRNVVLMQYLFSRAGSRRISSLRLIANGRVWLKSGLLSKGMSCTLNCALVPMARRCRTKMS